MTFSQLGTFDLDNYPHVCVPSVKGHSTAGPCHRWAHLKLLFINTLILVAVKMLVRIIENSTSHTCSSIHESSAVVVCIYILITLVWQFYLHI